MESPKFKIKYFGSKSSQNEILQKLDIIKNNIEKIKYYLVIAGTETSQVKGISAAGMNSFSRKKTALADAEFLLFGAKNNFKYKLPILKAGVSPALISNVCAKLLEANFTVIPIGVYRKPYFNHISVEDSFGNPSKCLSSGQSMNKKRVKKLYEKGLAIGLQSSVPIFISESVPGGTSTAQAIMEAYGLNVSNLVGSSLLNPPRNIKRQIIIKGLKKANLEKNFNVIDVISSVGDPFQAFTLGLLIGARKSNQLVILAGGSQMIAILLLALEDLSCMDKQLFANNVFIMTTGWLMFDKSLSKLLDLVAEKHTIKLYGFANGLDFKLSTVKELLDYEQGYVKEGVGAGGMSLLANLKGFSYKEIVSECEFLVSKMREVGQLLTK